MCTMHYVFESVSRFLERRTRTRLVTRIWLVSCLSKLWAAVIKCKSKGLPTILVSVIHYSGKFFDVSSFVTLTRGCVGL
jgi:hypothetical protein